MIVKVELYEKLRKHVENCIKTDTSVLIEDAIDFGIPFDCLLSLYSQLSLRLGSQELILASLFREEVIRKIDMGEESLRNLAHQSLKGNYTIAKYYLELKFGSGFKIASFLENPSIVGIPEVRHDLLRMITEDYNNSVEANLIKESTGKDYEDLLVEMLSSRNMCFETEEESRAKGKPKTPDVLFLIPMATPRIKLDSFDAGNTASNPVTSTIALGAAPQSGTRRSPTKRSSSTPTILNSSDDLLVINWIDSKAMFADRRTFQDHLFQLESYRNRYGRGMVIYWHGVVEDVYSLLSDDMIVVRSSFPEEWIFPTGEPADGRMPIFDTESMFSTDGITVSDDCTNCK